MKKTKFNYKFAPTYIYGLYVSYCFKCSCAKQIKTVIETRLEG